MSLHLPPSLPPPPPPPPPVSLSPSLPPSPSSPSPSLPLSQPLYLSIYLTLPPFLSPYLPNLSLPSIPPSLSLSSWIHLATQAFLHYVKCSRDMCVCICFACILLILITKDMRNENSMSNCYCIPMIKCHMCVACNGSYHRNV